MILNGDTKSIATIDHIRRYRSEGLWVTFDRNGKHVVQVPYGGADILIPISFCEQDDIRHVLSYRWAGAYGQKLEGNDAPIDFLRIASEERVWVDYLNHLNHEDLKRDVINNMGQLYAKRPVLAKYLWDFNPDDECAGISKLLACITRGWIWQEMAFSGNELIPPNAELVRLLIELIKVGAEPLRCIIKDGFMEPKDKDVNEVIKFSIDVLWRARNLADNKSAYRFFIKDSKINKDLILQAISEIKKYRENKECNPLHLNLLAALDNLENANFTKVEDCFNASFSTLLQSYPEELGHIKEGEVAPEGFDQTVTDILCNLTEKQNWDIEWWQQCTIDHPLSQLCHPRINSILVNGDDIQVFAEGDKQFNLKSSYIRQLQGVLDKDENLIQGKYDILNLSYRIQRGSLIVVGFQTKCNIRVVPTQGIQVTKTKMEVDPDPTNSSKWTQTTWYSRDADWLKVLDKWENHAKSNGSSTTKVK